MARLRQLLRPYRSAVVTVLMTLTLQTVLSLADPLFVQRLLDWALPSPAAVQRIVELAGLYLIVVILRTGLEWVLGISYARLGGSVGVRLRTQLVEHLVDVAGAALPGRRQGDLMAVVGDDVGVVSEFVTDSLVTVTMEMVMLVGTAAFLFYFDWRLALVVSAGVATQPWLLRVIQPRVRAVARDERSANASHMAALSEFITALPRLRIAVAEDQLLQEYGILAERLRGLGVRLAGLRAAGPSLAEVAIAVLRNGVLLAYGGNQVVTGHLAVGTLVAFFMYSERVVGPLFHLLHSGVAFQAASGAAERIYGILDTVPTVCDAADAKPLPPDLRSASLVWDNVTFRYTDSDHPALEQITISVSAGEWLAVVGGSGAGKSTLACLAVRLADPEQGRVLVADQDIRAIRQRSLRDRVVMVPQDPLVVDGTLRENIALGIPGADLTGVQWAARTAQLDTFATSLVAGYDTPLGEWGAKASGGERQRVALARAILRRPAILLLDEGTSALDQDTEARLLGAIREQLPGTTVVLITHRLRSAALSTDRIACLEAGRLVGIGSHQDLLTHCTTYRRLWVAQPSRPG